VLWEEKIMFLKTAEKSLLVLLLGVAAVMAADPPKPLPLFSELKQAVLSYFQAQPDYQPGDLITREQVAPLLVQVEKLGLPLPEARQLLEKVLPQDSFMARQFSTSEGRAFMRQIKEYPNGYDRVDRLSRLPRGQGTVRELIHGPGGAQMIQYMTTAPGGINLGDMLSNDPNGEHFNSPTGRIYTADMLLAQLQRIHEVAEKAAKKPTR
jgi:hypothetical protein